MKTHRGWPKPIHDIYIKAVNELAEHGSSKDRLLFGPAHIVWEDENFDTAQWCIDNFDDYAQGFTQREREIVMQSLVELAQAWRDLPNEVKEQWGEDEIAE